MEKKYSIQMIKSKIFTLAQISLWRIWQNAGD